MPLDPSLHSDHFWLRVFMHCTPDFWPLVLLAAADQTQQMARQMAMQGAGGGGLMGGGKQPNMNQLFKDEWEALQVVQHSDSLDKIESDLLLMNDPELPLTDPQLKKRD